jgi:hypothetical protein
MILGIKSLAMNQNLILRKYWHGAFDASYFKLFKIAMRDQQ